MYLMQKLLRQILSTYRYFRKIISVKNLQGLANLEGFAPAIFLKSYGKCQMTHCQLSKGVSIEKERCFIRNLVKHGTCRAIRAEFLRILCGKSRRSNL